MPALAGVIETAIYVGDMERASLFYENVFELQKMAGDDRFCAYSVAGRDVLLLFKRGGTTQPFALPGGIIPPHDGSGQNHFAFAIAKTDLAEWETHLEHHSIVIEGRVNWERGGTSLYFRDPDNNLLELATPGMWPIY
jgi:catechol-2,3-dioxygenase